MFSILVFLQFTDPPPPKKYKKENMLNKTLQIRQIFKRKLHVQRDHDQVESQTANSTFKVKALSHQRKRSLRSKRLNNEKLGSIHPRSMTNYSSFRKFGSMPNQPSSSEIRMSEFRIFQHLKGVGK